MNIIIKSLPTQAQGTCPPVKALTPTLGILQPTYVELHENYITLNKNIYLL